MLGETAFSRKDPLAQGMGTPLVMAQPAGTTVGHREGGGGQQVSEGLSTANIEAEQLVWPKQAECRLMHVTMS